MSYFVLLSVLHLFLILDVIHSEKPPTVKGNFYAVGEIVTTKLDDNTKEPLQTDFTIFDESFDLGAKATAVQFQAQENVIRITEDLELSESFVIVGQLKDLRDGNCQGETTANWIDMNIEPHLKEVEVLNGKIVLPIRQLLLLQEKSLVDKSSNVNYRGVSSHMWLYELSEGVKIEAYWSIGDWTSPSVYHAIPLGFKIIRKDSVTYINIMNFQHEKIESSLFEPVRGVYCENRTDVYPFPKEIRELEQFSYSTEFVLKDNMVITTVDTWIDMPNQIMRTDYDPFGRDADYYHSFTEIISSKQGAKYEFSKEVDDECLVDPITTNSDMQILFDYTVGSKWNATRFFGLDQTEYIYVGRTTERGIPCNLHHGIRQDFPYGSTGFKTLWEWCTTDRLKSGTEKAFPIVSLNIYFKQVNERVTTLPKEIVPGSRLTYHFYNPQHNFEAIQLMSDVFDIQNCFAAVNKTGRVLSVQVTDKQRESIQQLVHDSVFLHKWYEVLLSSSSLKRESLRLTNIRIRIGATGPLYVFFTLLNRHPDLPPKVLAEELLLKEVLPKLEEAIKNKQISVSQVINGEVLTLVAEKMEPVARSPSAKTGLLSPESKKVNSVTKNDPIAVQFSPEITNQHKSKAVEDGWALGIVVGVGAAMLVSGVGLGIFSGASGIFLKRRYAPSAN